MSIAKLEPVALRELWKHEERGFSAWLEDNIEALSDVLRIHLTSIQREKPVGSFQVDLLAEDSENNPVIIENQLEPTDHDHLGKLITYLTNLEAKVAIWITSEPRSEHMTAFTWLNQVTPDDISFYLVQLSAYRIGNSDPAPLFTVIVRPSIESKDIGRNKTELAERHVLRLRFWEQLLDRAKTKGVMLHANRSPSKDNWISTGAGKTGFEFSYVIWLEKSGVELYIDMGNKDQNKRAYEFLLAKKEGIEADFGHPLSWQRLDDKRASRIQYVIPDGGLHSEDKWDAIQDAMIDAMNHLSKALKPQIQALRE